MIKLEGDYYHFIGKTVTLDIDGEFKTGIIVADHPNFDISLVRNEHYYGDIDYYLKVN